MRLGYQLIHCDALLYIDKGSGHQVRPVYPYWSRANATDRSAEDHDGHACSFTGVHNRSLGEDLEKITYWLAPNDDYGYMVPIINHQTIFKHFIILKHVFYHKVGHNCKHSMILHMVVTNNIGKTHGMLNHVHPYHPCRRLCTKLVCILWIYYSTGDFVSSKSSHISIINSKGAVPLQCPKFKLLFGLITLKHVHMSSHCQRRKITFKREFWCRCKVTVII